MSVRNDDYHDILAALVAEEARFLVVGAYARAVGLGWKELVKPPGQTKAFQHRRFLA